jgi:hypothetical protein
MDDETRQAAGYLCRWLLLAAAAGVVVAFCWVAASAVSSEPVGEAIDAVLVDQVCGPHGRTRAFGYITPSVPDEAAPLFAATGPGRGVWLAHIRKDALSTLLHGLGETDFHPLPSGAESAYYTSRMRGLMYGTFAFERSEALVAVVPTSRRVFAVDARLLDGPDEDALRRAIKAMTARGQVAVFAPPWAGRSSEERMELYRALRTTTRDLLGRLPVVAVLGGGYGEMGPVMQMDWTLARRSVNKPVVVTASATLARESAARGFPTRLVGAEPPAPPWPELTVYRDLEGLASWLESQ